MTKAFPEAPVLSTATPTCLISHFSGSEILVSLFRSSVSSCSTSGPWPRFKLLGRSGFLMVTSSLPSGPTFLLLLGFKSSPVSWSTSCDGDGVREALPSESWKNSWKVGSYLHTEAGLGTREGQDLDLHPLAFADHVGNVSYAALSAKLGDVDQTLPAFPAEQRLLR